MKTNQTNRINRLEKAHNTGAAYPMYRVISAVDDYVHMSDGRKVPSKILPPALLVTLKTYGDPNALETFGPDDWDE